MGTPYAQRDTLQRDTETPMPFDHKKNVYTGLHTFTSAGTHRITMEDPNRNLGIENIYTQSGGSSDDIVFALEAYLIIDPTQGLAGANNSPQFDDCPCPAIACVNKPYCYNPLAYDLDDDSLSYELVAPLGLDAVPLVIPSIYMFPDDVGGGNMTIDPVTGTVCWNNPMMQGEFNKINKCKPVITSEALYNDMNSAERKIAAAEIGRSKCDEGGFTGRFWVAAKLGFVRKSHFNACHIGRV